MIAARRADLRQEAGDERAGGESVHRALERGRLRLGVINFADPDMVGHTGVIEAAVEAWRRWTSAWARW